MQAVDKAEGWLKYWNSLPPATQQLYIEAFKTGGRLAGAVGQKIQDYYATPSAEVADPNIVQPGSDIAPRDN